MSLWSYSLAARELEIDRHDLAVLVRIMGIEPKPVPLNGKAKGLDEADMRRLRAVLKGRMKNLKVKVG